MSKIDIVALLEWADRQKTFAKPPKIGRKLKASRIPDNFDPIDYVRMRKEEVARWEKYLKDEEKLNKKDPPKPEYKGPTLRGIEWLIIGMLLYPVVGPMYHAVLKSAGLQ